MTHSSPDSAERPLLASGRASLYTFLAAATMAGVLLAGFLTYTYHDTLAAAEASSSNEATVLATRVDATLRRIRASADLIARRLASDATLWPQSGETPSGVDPALEDPTRDFAEVSSMAVYAADGRLAFTSAARPAGFNIADRGYFRAALNQAQQDIQFTETLNSKATGRGVVVAYRAIVARDGRALGVIAIALDLTHFSELFRQVSVWAAPFGSQRGCAG